MTLMAGQLLQVADAVAREKSIEKAQVLHAMEEAIQKAGRSKYGHEYDIQAQIDPQTGHLTLKRRWEVVAEITNPALETTLEDAKAIVPEIELGGFVEEELPFELTELGRIAAQTAKQVLVQKVREAERDREFEEYKNRLGEIASGTIKRVEFGNVIVDLGRAEALIRRDELIPREALKQGDRVRAYIFDVRRETRGSQIMLSRTHPQFMAKLFEQEVPEIYDGVIEVKGVARDPGSRAKISVTSKDPSVDPVGACVGLRGSRVQAVVNELQGEKIDIIPWSEDPAAFIVNALAPAEVTKIVLDEDANRIDVIVPDEQLSLAIGRRGQNVRLASMLSGWDIDIMTDTEESEKRALEYKESSQMFIKALDVDDVIAHLLVAEGFTSLEQIAIVAVDELGSIEGFTPEVAQELQSRAQEYVTEEKTRLTKELTDLGVTQELVDMQGITLDMIVALGKAGIKTKDDFADLATDELLEIVGEEKMKRRTAEGLIMKARESWFAEEDAAAEEENADLQHAS